MDETPGGHPVNAPAQSLLSFQDYLDMEARTGIKHEFWHGQAFAMGGGSVNHGRLQFNLSGLIHARLAKSPCEGVSPDVRVAIEGAGLYTYPDLTIICGGADVDEHESVRNPTLIAEVLSPSTEAYDRGAKFEMYRQLPSLRHYLLVSQDRKLVQLFTRQEEGAWTFQSFGDDRDVVPLPFIGVEVGLAELYRNIVLPPPTLRAATRDLP